MLYVSRDESGLVNGVFKKPNSDSTESLPYDHPDVLTFFRGSLPESLESRALLDLLHSDVSFIRVIEDVVHLLIDKNIITFTDLPEKVREKILSRADARGRLAGSNDLVVPDDRLL